jgi:hypothetical protein
MIIVNLNGHVAAIEDGETVDLYRPIKSRVFHRTFLSLFLGLGRRLK